jgi:hypothetical protein
VGRRFGVQDRGQDVCRYFAGAPLCLSLKCTPENFSELTERQGIVPAPYSARYHLDRTGERGRAAGGGDQAVDRRIVRTGLRQAAQEDAGGIANPTARTRGVASRRACKKALRYTCTGST